MNAPKLSELTKEEYSADLSDPNEDLELWNLARIYQIHRHSKTCRKYRKEKCRFHFEKYFTSRTVLHLTL